MFMFKMVKCQEFTENKRVHVKALHGAGWSLRQMWSGMLWSQLQGALLPKCTEEEAGNESYLKQMSDTSRF